MKEFVSVNRRETSRFELNISGELSLIIEERNYIEKIEVINISYNGIQIVFSNNSFLYDFLEGYENTESQIMIKFQHDNESYSFSTRIRWVRLYNLGEKDFYVLSGLSYSEKDKVESLLMSILLSIQMKNIYISKVS